MVKMSDRAHTPVLRGLKFKVILKIRVKPKRAIRYVYGIIRRSVKMSEKNELEELKQLMETGFNTINKRFDQVNDQFGKLKEEIKHVHARFQSVDQKIVELDGGISENLKQINRNLKGNGKG